MLIEVKVPASCRNRSRKRRWSPGTRSQGEFVQRDDNLDRRRDRQGRAGTACAPDGVLSLDREGRRIDGDEQRGHRADRHRGEGVRGIDACCGAAPSRPPCAAAAAAKAPPRSAAPAAGEVMRCRPAKKIAADNNIDVATVVGTGRGGRVTKEDVRRGRAGPHCCAGSTGACGRADPMPSPVHRCTARRSTREARPDVAAAQPDRRAPRPVAADGRDPDDVQRSEHAAGSSTCATASRTASRRSTA
jgi:pyruvate/2-oxoglutarate dehydrogenase complex dihydrolipoamide acyltransferase (E2) component